ncbi:MAG: TonB family protein [Candidatus Omnitrophica bacterium]|nr:TonB family protein [Candidatus Omnitrophota bacterium]
MQKKICEKCGKEFGCGAKEAKCWCFEVPLSEQKLKLLRDQYHDCLCGDCLKGFKVSGRTPSLRAKRSNLRDRRVPPLAGLAMTVLLFFAFGCLAFQGFGFSQSEESFGTVTIPQHSGIMAVPQTLRDFYSHNPLPTYPKIAREKGWQGKVSLRVLVSQRGTAVDAYVAESSGHPELDRAALEGIWKWKFRPAIIGGKPYSTWIRVPVQFKLSDPA